MILEWLVLLCFVIGAFSFGFDVLGYIIVGFMVAYTLVMYSELRYGGTFLDLGFVSFSWSRSKLRDEVCGYLDRVPRRIEVRAYFDGNLFPSTESKIWVLREGDVEYAREMDKRYREDNF